MPKIDENQLKNQIIDSLFVHAELWQRWKAIQHLPQFKITDVEHVEHFWLASTEKLCQTSLKIHRQLLSILNLKPFQIVTPAICCQFDILGDGVVIVAFIIGLWNTKLFLFSLSSLRRNRCRTHFKCKTMPSVLW